MTSCWNFPPKKIFINDMISSVSSQLNLFKVYLYPVEPGSKKHMEKCQTSNKQMKPIKQKKVSWWNNKSANQPLSSILSPPNVLNYPPSSLGLCGRKKNPSIFSSPTFLFTGVGRIKTLVGWIHSGGSDTGYIVEGLIQDT